MHEARSATQQGWMRQRMSNAADLPQSSKTYTDSCSYVRAHGDIRIQVNPEIPNNSDRLHRSATNTNGHSRDLMLTVCGRTPECFSLTAVTELQLINCHPGCHIVQAVLIHESAVHQSTKGQQISRICVSSTKSCGTKLSGRITPPPL